MYADLFMDEKEFEEMFDLTLYNKVFPLLRCFFSLMECAQRIIVFRLFSFSRIIS